MNLAAGTPTLVVRSNRNLPVRVLTYNRTKEGVPLEERIERRTYDALGRIETVVDARLSADGAGPNVRYRSALSGRVLRTESVDAGRMWVLADVDDRPVWSRNAREIVTTRTYDALGRPATVAEALAGGTPSVCDVWIYGDSEPGAQERNLRGQVVRYYDTAGQLTSSDYTLNGQAKQQSRRWLAVMSEQADWQAESEQHWDSALVKGTYITRWTYDALGGLSTQTDARGNRTRWRLDVAGMRYEIWFKLAGVSAEQIVASDICYDAAGQMLSEKAGNGVSTRCKYEPQTQRLSSACSRKADGTILQRVAYRYDPVGNVIGTANTAKDPQFFRNQKVAAQAEYQYDALYQLKQATGRENAKNVRPGRGAPTLVSDPYNLVKYTQNYTYDLSGNLTSIEHRGANSWRTDVVISQRSNRGVVQQDQYPSRPDGVDGITRFDACGNSLQLQQGAMLTWNGRNQLVMVTLGKREGESEDDRETYGYDGTGARVWKRTHMKTNGTWRTEEVIYLPGLELRTTYTNERVGEQLSVMIPCIAVRVLHWENQPPVGMQNDQYRYCSTNFTGSVIRELDAHGMVLTVEEYYPYGGSAVWAGDACEANYKFVRYSGKERDRTGLYYYGYRYYLPWLGRWCSADPAGTFDGLNLYRMVRNNPITLTDPMGLAPKRPSKGSAQESKRPLFNMKMANSHEITVYRVEVADFNENYNHVFVEGGNAHVYYPKPKSSGVLPNGGGQYEMGIGGYMHAGGSNNYIKTKMTPPWKGMSIVNYSRAFFASRQGGPQGTMGWLNFGNPERAVELYKKKVNKEPTKKWAIKSFDVPSGVYVAIAQTAILEDDRKGNHMLPLNVDTEAANQFGVQSHHLDLINRMAIHGTARVYNEPTEVDAMLRNAPNHIGSRDVKQQAFHEYEDIRR